jgi:hypothetical protein
VDCGFCGVFLGKRGELCGVFVVKLWWDAWQTWRSFATFCATKRWTPFSTLFSAGLLGCQIRRRG